MAAHIVAVITFGLVLDIRFGWFGQHLATVWTASVFAWLYWHGRTLERRVLVLCMLIAGAGEVVLSLWWGVYDYQFGNVPLFVPPGHALLMTLGLLCVRYAPSAITPTIVTGALVWSCYAAIGGFDHFGLALCGVFVACMWLGSAKKLYAIMFALALAMELYGTALGNWVWHSTVPLFNISAANPPFSAGAFYSLLDLLVLAALGRFAASATPPQPSQETSTASAQSRTRL